MNVSSSKYSFLEILRETEAVQRGANLADKVNHAVFKTIQSMTTKSNARQNNLFTTEVKVPDVVNLTEKNLIAVLQRLIGDRVIAQIFRLDFLPDQTDPVLTACFVAHPTGENEMLDTVYEETVLRSASAVSRILDQSGALSQAGLLQDLEADLAIEGEPPPGTFKRLVVQPFTAVHASKFPIIPVAELIKDGVKHVRDELIRTGKVKEIINYGLMPAPPNVSEVFEWTEAFFAQKVIPRYRSRGNLRNTLEGIDLEEKSYRTDEFAPPTTTFAERRATAVKQTVHASPEWAGGGRFPGALALEILLAYCEDLERERRSLHRDESLQFYNERKADLTAESDNWADLIIFISEQDREDIPPDAWQAMANDAEILYGRWERRTGTEHIFIAKRVQSFRVLVRGMMHLPVERNWQILAMRSLLEANENSLPGLFEDETFVQRYGELMRKVYVDYMPWYHRMLLQFGINWFIDAAFAIAKGRIGSEQGAYRTANDEKARQLTEQRQKEKDLRLARIRDAAESNKIIEKMDGFLFQKSYIPDINELRGELPDMSAEDFDSLTNRLGFQTVPAQDDAPALLLYPMDHDWRVRAARLRKVLDGIVEKYPANSPQQDRARRVKRFLSRAGSTKPDRGDRQPGKSDDPEEAYRRFGAAVDQHRRRDAPTDSADLDI